MLDPGVAIAVRGIGRREHGLRECGEAENAEEAEGLGCGIIPSMQAVCSTKRGPRCLPHSRIGQQQARTSHAGGAWKDKGLKTGQRETDAEQSSDSFSAREETSSSPDHASRSCILWSFRPLQQPASAWRKKKYGKWKYLISKRQGRLPARHHGTCTRLVHGVSRPATVAAS